MRKQDQDQEEFEPIVDPEMIDSWLAKLDVSDKTKRLYRLGMKAFEGFARENGHNDLDALTEEDVLEFKRQLLGKCSPSTVSAYLIGVRSFYRSPASEGLKDIAANVGGAPKARGFKKDILSPEQAEKMLDAAWGDTELEKRNYAILNLMLRTGLRDIEVVRADVGDIDRNGIRPVLHVQGKGRAEKDAFVVLTERSLGPIEDYLHVRKRANVGADSDEVKELNDDAPLFASVSNRNLGGRLTTRTVSGIAKAAMRAIGIDDARHSAHSLRHTAVTYALLGDARLEEAQQMARHADVSTTQLYAHHVERLKNPAEAKIDKILD